MFFVAHRKIWYTISLTLTVLSLLSIALFGLKLGIDFTGGSLLEARFISSSSPMAVSAIESVFKDAGIQEVRVQSADNGAFIAKFESVAQSQYEALLTQLSDRAGGTVEVLKYENVGPSIGKELANRAAGGLILATLMIVAYISWAFRKSTGPIASWKYGLATIIALVHDVTIPLGVFALLGHLYDYQVDGSFVAAILIIWGYSVSDTVVVFDRVRERLSKSSADFEVIVENGITQTLTRSINTSFTTFLAIAALYFFGGDSLKHFSLVLMLGVIVGAYSSIFLASPLLVSWQKHAQR